MVEGSALHLDQRAQLADAGRARTGEGEGSAAAARTTRNPTSGRSDREMK
jgi:hypothetical protein